MFVAGGGVWERGVVLMTGLGGAAVRVGPLGDWCVGWCTTGLVAAWSPVWLEFPVADCVCVWAAEVPAGCAWCCVPALFLVTVEGFTTTILATAGGVELEPVLTPSPTAGRRAVPESRIQGSATPASASATTAGAARRAIPQIPVPLPLSLADTAFLPRPNDASPDLAARNTRFLVGRQPGTKPTFAVSGRINSDYSRPLRRIGARRSRVRYVSEPIRCWPTTDPLYIAYHDEEWGRPVRDERGLYERLCLEGFQSGLAWITVLRKREGFRRAFAGFDPDRVARFGERDVERLLADAGIVRHRGKIEAAIANARATLALRETGTSLGGLMWEYRDHADGKELSRRLRGAGYRFVGPTTAYSAMEACGIVNGHRADCWVRGAVEAERRAAR